jgi:hypothetical protein
MARVPLPERGQPLDVAYIYSLATAINDLATQVNSNSYNQSTIYTPTMGNQNIKTGEVSMLATTQQVTNSEQVSADTTKEMGFNFPTDFKYPPIVTVTPINVGGNPYGNNVIVSVKEVTTGRVDYTVRYNVAGQVSVSVNIIAVGIPQ